MFGRKKSSNIARTIDVSYIIDKETGDKYLSLSGDYEDRGGYKVIFDLDFAKRISDSIKEVLDVADSN